MHASISQHHSLIRAAGLDPDPIEPLLAAQVCVDRLFRLLVLKPLKMDTLESLYVKNLSGGELQRVAITLCLGQKASVYLLDEPSAGLDCEQRIIAAKVRRE